MRRGEVIAMDNQRINRVLKNYEKRSKQTDQVVCVIVAKWDYLRKTILSEQSVMVVE
jgi:hypothetical protein